MPVVSTTVGSEGLDVVDGQHLLIADGPRRFADRCIELLRDPGLRHRLAAQGRGLVAQRYTWKRIRGKLVESALAVTAVGLRACV